VAEVLEVYEVCLLISAIMLFLGSTHWAVFWVLLYLFLEND
tara:strand:+ start:500 stop:622 length:123 start_codon:yes stop_codon:yes gene_type:complete